MENLHTESDGYDRRFKKIRQWKFMLGVFILLVVIMFLVLIYPHSFKSLSLAHIKSSVANGASKYSRWDGFDTSPDLNSCSKTCTSVKELQSLLYRMMNGTICHDSWRLIDNIFSVTSRSGQIALDTREYQNKVMKWLGNDSDLFKQVFNQTIVSIYNKYTQEETVFNPLRAKRPIAQPDLPEVQYVDEMYNKTKGLNCDFCNYLSKTARDVTGRLSLQFAHTAANTFRYEGKHQLVISSSHHPLHWNRTVMFDMFNLAKKWAREEYDRDRSYAYPVITWDTLPHAGASQIHPHLQVILTPHRYPGVVESWRKSAERYYRDFSRNYFTDLLTVHQTLGLSVGYKSAAAFVSLTPKKENEIVIMSKEFSQDYLELLYRVIRMYIDKKGLFTFSMTMALPKFTEQPSKSVGFMPAITRIVSRGVASEIRSDISSLELFTFYNVNSDPFLLSKELKAFNSEQKV